MQAIRWGILGPGSISRKFAADLRLAEGAEIVAVGSRDQDRADGFATEFEIPYAHGSYQSLAEDPRVDAVYIGTPHAFHAKHALLCLDHGKHVLCEKSLALNAPQAERMIQAARENDLLLMEAMWTRFLPAVVRLRELLAGGLIGEPRQFIADFGFRAEFDPASRLFDPTLGGGTLLDLGVYPVSFASMLFGDPIEVGGAASLGRTGVDEEACLTLRHAGGELASAALSFRVDTPREGVVLGTDGWVRIHRPWWGATRLTVHHGDGSRETLEFPERGYGYQYEADEFMALIRDGRRDSSIMPLQESLAIMRTMDTLRSAWGVKYPE